MPATSQHQQRLMGMALAYKRGKLRSASATVRKVASGMSEQQLHDFAATPRHGLPQRVSAKKSAKKKRLQRRMARVRRNDTDQHFGKSILPWAGAHSPTGAFGTRGGGSTHAPEKMALRAQLPTGSKPTAYLGHSGQGKGGVTMFHDPTFAAGARGNQGIKVDAIHHYGDHPGEAKGLYGVRSGTKWTHFHAPHAAMQDMAGAAGLTIKHQSAPLAAVRQNPAMWVRSLTPAQKDDLLRKCLLWVVGNRDRLA